ncbi:TP53-binding protein 1-like [Stegodyphus dumicola]|uniref:TP53-binding protein 1-like n=1 Tax=Stegodyphus dumicola TaxID=202533 RepID=UPI0015AA2E19|nr:TP53-binding protein 1-like [Stegodyphus dumicola]
MKSGVELESASKEENAIVSQLFVKISTSSVNEAQIKEYKSEISKSLDEEGVTESHKESKESEPPSSNAGTPTRFLLPKKPPQKGSLSSRKQKDEEKKHIQDISSEKQGRLIGTFKDNASFEKIFHSFGIVLDHECFETVLSLKPNEETKITKISRFSVRDNKVFLEECLEVEYPHEQQRHLIAISPQSSSSTTTSSTFSTKMSLHSGEIGDVSSSSSSKSANSSGIQMDTTSHSSHIFSSQETNVETFQKTSTQNSANVNSFSGIVRRGKGDDKTSDASKMDFELCSIKIPVSPIKGSVHEPTAEAPAPASSKCKKGEKKNVKVEVTGTKCKRMKPVKRKRGNIPNDLEFKESDSNEESTTKKLPRRKKSKTVEPVTKLQPAKESSDVEEIQIAEDGGGAYEESHFGNIIPGVRVMARWKDGYYYPGTVKSQELEGRWAVLFDDGDLRTIPQENLIKLAMLQLGTSVLVLSADGFYDPGKVCGHFREGNKVGYEVELDNGVTKRYPRTSVILSTEQAKHIISSRPPTTPATMTINLDNIIDGKRKRKSVQSPQSSPVLKKSPRISHRNLKPDSNLDSTSESHVELSGSKTSDAVADVEEPSKKRAVRTRRAAKASAVKTTKAIVQRSKKVAKLFKDYAFLLTNAERKNIPKPVSNESECSAEEYDIIPFDKDELCQYIVSGGGLILDRFDDIQTCTKKNIFLLANSYLRTMKYIQCIAAGIHCIKHHWVQNCIFKGEIMPVQSYYLPAGYSLVTQKIVEWHGKKDVLKGLKIALVSAPESPFVYTWAPVLLASKADFVQKWSLPSSAKPGCSVYVDVLITNGQCPPEILQSAKRRKIPIVSSEWIIQSLISGKCLPFDAHPKFKHDFSE